MKNKTKNKSRKSRSSFRRLISKSRSFFVSVSISWVIRFVKGFNFFKLFFLIDERLCDLPTGDHFYFLPLFLQPF